MNIKKIIAPGVVGLSVVAGLAGGSAINAISASAATTTANDTLEL